MNTAPCFLSSADPSSAAASSRRQSHRRPALVAALALAAGCAWAADLAPTPTPPTAVGVTFGADAKQNGITTTLWSKPGGETVATHGGKSGTQTDLTNGAWGWWGHVDRAFVQPGANHVKVAIEYWDKPAKGEQAIKFYYDSTEKPLARAPSIFLTGTNTWKTATLLLPNAAFGGREENGADFKLFSTDTDICVRGITIEQIPAVVPVTKVRVEPARADMIAGNGKNLCVIYAPVYATDKGVTWTSSATPVATVNDLGQVTAVGAGTAVITATTHAGGPAGTCTVQVTAVPGTGILATRAGDFLDTIGINSSISNRGETLAKTIDCMKYVGFRWIRSGVGLDYGDYVALNKATGCRFSLMFGGDMGRFLHEARQIAAGKMLLAFEGPNEPNNWGLIYQDVKGGGSDSWVPIAKLQSDFYNAVKSDPVLCPYPVWHVTEGGAETDNAGMQWLHVPQGAHIAVPDGMQLADYACVHNYISHPSWQGLHDNQSWLSSDPTDQCPVDGLYKEFGTTWAKHFPGYSGKDLITLPRVTTETGTTIDSTFTEELQGRLYLDIYLDQFKQGWSWTSIYILRDRVDEGGNQTFGFFAPDYHPRKAATYLHNLTTIIADPTKIAVPGRLDYSIANQPATVHDLLLQKADGEFDLVVWGERYPGGQDDVKVSLGAPFATVKVYDPTVGTDPVQTLNNVDTVPVTLTTNPVVIVVGPGK